MLSVCLAQQRPSPEGLSKCFAEEQKWPHSDNTRAQFHRAAEAEVNAKQSSA